MAIFEGSGLIPRMPGLSRHKNYRAQMTDVVVTASQPLRVRRFGLPHKKTHVAARDVFVARESLAVVHAGGGRWLPPFQPVIVAVDFAFAIVAIFEHVLRYVLHTVRPGTKRFSPIDPRRARGACAERFRLIGRKNQCCGGRQGNFLSVSRCHLATKNVFVSEGY